MKIISTIQPNMRSIFVASVMTERGWKRMVRSLARTRSLARRCIGIAIRPGEQGERRALMHLRNTSRGDVALRR